ncbi:MAG: hypothetical protein AB1631_11260 [Acidobacteriota bacterium]
MSDENNPHQLSAEAAARRQEDASTPREDLAASGSLEKVREILFGAQARDYERRFSRLEDRLIKESLDLRDEMKKRFDSLESFIKKEVDSLNSRLRAEAESREKADQELSQAMAEIARAFDKRASQIEEQMAKETADIRDQMLQQYKNLMDEILQKHKEISASLERDARELRSDKVDRFALAAMFNEVALRLNNNLVIPIPEDESDD